MDKLTVRWAGGGNAGLNLDWDAIVEMVLNSGEENLETPESEAPKGLETTGRSGVSGRLEAAAWDSAPST